MKCLVTGGAGFIGSNLVDKLINEGHDVVVIDDMSTGKDKNINPKVEFFRRDISEMNNFSMFQGVDIVFHLAALARVQPSIENPIEYHNVNVNGTLNVLKACVDYDVKRFIFSSSSSVYGDVEEINLPTDELDNTNPMSPYAIHKLIGEQYCKLFSELYNLETVCLRYFNVYGERQPIEGAYTLVMGVFAQQLLDGKPMTIRGDGEQKRDFTYVGDVVDANIKCMNYPLEFNGDIFNVGNGDNLSVNQIAELMNGDTINIEPVIEPKATLADNNKIKKILGWKPVGNIKEWIPNWKKELNL
tara:strand:+ start:1105 stop:2007 length:903 start_codon:yes stop_codon:yes gene_type:complete